MKLVATLFNALAVVSLATAVINPVANRHYDVVSDGGWILLLAAASLHLAAHAAFHFLQAED